ncbi:MAG: hypothetical protein ABIP51_03910 [Bacteroidia bacterium]
MKLLPVFLKNNISNEFYITNFDCKRIIPEQLICRDARALELENCTIYINDLPFRFVKDNRSNYSIFYLDRFQSNFVFKSLEALSNVKFRLRLNCPKEAEEKFKDMLFHLHFRLEKDLTTKLFQDKDLNSTSVSTKNS